MCRQSGPPANLAPSVSASRHPESTNQPWYSQSAALCFVQSMEGRSSFLRGREARSAFASHALQATPQVEQAVTSLPLDLATQPSSVSQGKCHWSAWSHEMPL